MFVPKKASASGTNKRTIPAPLKDKTASEALFNLEAYLKNRDFVGALTLLRLTQLQERENDSSSGSASGIESWRMNTWWLAYCHFQCGHFAGALEYFEQLLQSESDPSGKSGASNTSASADANENDSWRLSRACCLYYLHRFEDAEQAALSTKRHALCNRLLYLIAHRRKHGEQVLLDRYQQLSLSCREDQLAMAFTSFLQRNFQECIEIYKRLLQQHQKDELGAVHVYLAMCYFKSDYYDVSLELLAVYLASHPDSFFASNLKACNQYRLYSGYEALQVIEDFKRKYPKHPCAQKSGANEMLDAMGIREVADHNSVVFQESNGLADSSTAAAAVAILKPLIGQIDEAPMNLALFYLQHREYQLAFELVEDMEPSTPSECIIKGILHAVIGEQTHSKEHVFLAEKYFHTVGTSPEEADTIPGRQSMASYFLLRKEYADANVYLHSIAQYLSSNDNFNWNYGISLAAAGNYAEAEEVLLRVRSDALTSHLTLCSWLARCYIYNDKNPGHAWELYLKMESTSDAYKLLKLIANDYYKVKNYYYAVKAFDVLERLDPDPEYWEAKRGACVGFFQQMALGEGGAGRFERSDEVLQLLVTSKNALEASKVAAILKKWMVLLFAQQRKQKIPNDITETSFWTRTQRERRMEEAVAVTQELQPWGRFKFVSREPAEESDHLYFYKKTHTIGRNAARADIIIDKLFISASHCVVMMEDNALESSDDDDTQPTIVVKLQDLSRNGVYVNEERVGKSNTVVLEPNFTIHFTKPGLRSKTMPPTVYRFELLPEGLTRENARLRNELEAEQGTTTTTPSQTPSGPGSGTAPAPSSSASIRATQDTATPSKKRPVSETEFDVEITKNLSATINAEGGVGDASSSVSGSSAKKKKRRSPDPDEGIEDELNTSATIQKVNHDLRQKLQDSTDLAVQLRAQLGDVEVELVALTEQLDKANEHGKKLQREVDGKAEQATEYEKEVERLKQDKLVLEGKIADTVQALEAANEKLEVHASLLKDLEADKKASEKNASMATLELRASLEKIADLEAKVKSLEAKNRRLEVANFSVQSRTTLVEEDKSDVQEEKLVMASGLAAALQLFDVIHKQVLRGQRLIETPGIANAVKDLNRRRQLTDDHSSLSTEQSLDDLRHLTDTSVLSSEQSQPTPVHSSDVNTQDADEEETMGQEAAAAPLPAENSFLLGAQQILQQQVAEEGGETKRVPGASDVETQEPSVPSAQPKEDSEESAVSGHSSTSKTPLAVPSIQCQTTPSREEEEEEETAAAGDETHEERQERGDVAHDGDEEEEEAEDEVAQQEQEGEEDQADQEDRNGDDDDVGDDDDDVGDDDDDVGDDDDDGDDDDKDDDENDDEGAAEEEVVEETKAPPTESETEGQRWPANAVKNDESLDDQANASDDGDIFDDETQLSE